MNIKNIKWEEWVHNATRQFETKWKPDIDEHFLDHIIPILGAIPLIWEDHPKYSRKVISATKTLKNMPDVLEYPNGTISGVNVNRIIGFLYHMPRSTLIKGSQIANPRLGGLTPIPMYAQKLHNGIRYNQWNEYDPWCKFFLGKMLEPLTRIRTGELTVPLVDDNDINLNRIPALKYMSGPKVGLLAKLTDYKCNIDHIEVSREEDDEDHDGSARDVLEFPLPPIAIRMLLQTWLANVSVRDTSSMILNPENWDVWPKPVDSKVESIQEEIPWM